MKLRHAFLIVAHKQPELLLKIMKFLIAENHYFIVNLDKKMHECKEVANRILDEIPNSIVLYNNVAHGGYSQIDVTIKLLIEGNKINADYYHLISGQDFPCKSVKDFDNFFENHEGESFMMFDSEEQNRLWQKKKYPSRLNRYCFNDLPGTKHAIMKLVVKLLNHTVGRINMRKPLANVRAGWNWFTWHKQVVDFVLDKYENDINFFQRFHFTSCCDEVIFHTLLYPHVNNLKIHTDNSLRYINWSKMVQTRRIKGSPLILNLEELSDIENGQFFFCRKVDEKISKELIDLLSQKLLS